MIKSPCINICDIDVENNTCKGCGRSINQITQWVNYTDKERSEIISNIKNNSKKLSIVGF